MQKQIVTGHLVVQKILCIRILKKKISFIFILKEYKQEKGTLISHT